MATNRTIPVSGFLFAVATFSGLMLLLPGVAIGNSDNTDAARWLGDSGHRVQMFIGMYLMSGGGIAFAVFAVALVRRLRTAKAPNVALDVAFVAAAGFAILVLIAAVGMASGAFAVVSGVESTPVDPQATRLSTLGFALWAVPAALAAALFVASVSVATLTSGALPRWLSLFGLLISGVLCFGVVFLPSLAVIVWAILVSAVSLVRPGPGIPIPAGRAPV